MSGFEITPGLDAFASATHKKINLDKDADQVKNVPDLIFVDHNLSESDRVTRGIAFIEMIGRELPVTQTPLTRVEQVFFADDTLLRAK